MPPTDKILLQEFAVTRSPSAFDQIAVRHGGMVYASILRTVRNRNLAEEATQAVFLVLAQKAGTLAPHTPLASWLLKAARYAAIDLLRKESRHARHERRASAQRPEAVDPLPEEDPRLAAMEEALLSLTTADREALLLRYHHNEPFAQIAISLDTTPEAARKRIARALARMRRLLRRRGAELTAAMLAALLLAGANSARCAAAASFHWPAIARSRHIQSLAQRIHIAFAQARLHLFAAIAAPSGIAVILLILLNFTSFAQPPQFRPFNSPTSAQITAIPATDNILPPAREFPAPAVPAAESLTLAPPIHSAFFVALVNMHAPPAPDDDELQPQSADPVTCIILGIQSSPVAASPPGNLDAALSHCRLSLAPICDQPHALVSLRFPLLVLGAPDLLHVEPSPLETPLPAEQPRIVILAILPLPRFPQF